MPNIKLKRAIAWVVAIVVCCIGAYLLYCTLQGGHSSAHIAQRSVSSGSAVVNAARHSWMTLPPSTGSVARRPMVRPTAPARAATTFNRPMPPKGLPWSDVYDMLMERAEDGDAAAADRLYGDTLHCRRYRSIAAQVNDEVSSYKQPDLSPAMLRYLDKRLAALERELTLYTSVCKGVDPKALKTALVPVVKQAAVLGNQAAQSCYVSGDLFRDDTYDDADHVAEKSDYAKLLPGFVVDGLHAGNWRTVRLMEDAYSEPMPQFNGPGTWLNQVIKPDPLSNYSYLLLERRGMGASATQLFDDKLSDIVRSNKFSDAKIAAARAWADETYSTYFAGSPFPKSRNFTYCPAP